MRDPAGGPSAPDPARSSRTCLAFRSARGEAFSLKWISRPTANTRSTSPTWPRPFGAKGSSPTPSRERIFSCRPENATASASAKATADRQDACAKQIITSLARRAYRRPVSAEDVNELLPYYQDGVKDINNGGFEGGIRSAITGLLASPFFLYRAERVPSGLRPGTTYTIIDMELAYNRSFS